MLTKDVAELLIKENYYVSIGNELLIVNGQAFWLKPVEHKPGSPEYQHEVKTVADNIKGLLF